MTEHLHAIVWIGSSEAKIFYVDAAAADKLVVPANSTSHYLRKKANAENDRHHEVDKEFFNRVVAALANAADIVVVGPTHTKSELKNYMADFVPDLASHIVGVEAMDHPSDRQLIALARKFFKSTTAEHAQ